MSEEAGVSADIELMPTDDRAQDNITQEGVSFLLRAVKMMVSSVQTDLGIEPPKASAVVMSIMATATMLYVRGYPREAHVVHFRALHEYFGRMAAEEEAKTKGDANGNASNPD